MVCQLQEAKNKFSEVVETSLRDGPQVITRRGKKTVIVVDYDTYVKQSKPTRDFMTLLADFKDLDFPEVDRPRDFPDGRATPFDINNLL